MAGIWAGGAGNAVEVRNSLLAKNSAVNGGGLFLAGSFSVKLVNLTIVENRASLTGGGIFSERADHVSVINSILWGNKADGVDSQAVGLFNANFAFSGIQGWTGGHEVNGNINLQAANNGTNRVGQYYVAFVDPGNGDYTLSGNSYAINRGENFFVNSGETDLNGDNRVHNRANGGRVDMGAYESTLKGNLIIGAESIQDIVYGDFGAFPVADRDGYGEGGYSYTSSDSNHVEVVNGQGLLALKANELVVITVDYAGDDNWHADSDTVTVNTLRRDIVIKAKDETVTYDGNDHSLVWNGDSSGFVLDDCMGDYVSPQYRNAGIYENEQVIHTADFQSSSRGDVTGNYNITYEGTLTIGKRVLTVNSASASWVYDGVEHRNQEWKVIDGSFVIGEGFASVDVTGKITYVGSVENTIADYVLQSNTQADNYVIHKKHGTLAITKASIVITVGADSDSKIYDGEKLTEDGWNLLDGTLIKGDLISTVDINGSQLNAGMSDNIITSVIITNNGVDVTENYVISTEKGTLEVTRREITITSGDGNWVYDGKVHRNPLCDVTEGSFAAGEGFADIDVTGEITYVGMVENTIADYILQDNTLAGNYVIHKVHGTLEITKASIAITVTADSSQKMYDGSVLTDNGWDLSIGTLLYGDQISTVGVNGSQLNAGMSDNIITSVIITHDGVDVTENYVISTENGTLEVTQREIIIVSGDGTWVYDGKVHANPNYKVNGDGFVKREGLESVDVTGKIVNVGSVDNTIAGHQLRDNTLAENYKITTVNGTLTILPREGGGDGGQNTWQDSSSMHYHGRPEPHEESRAYPVVDSRWDLRSERVSFMTRDNIATQLSATVLQGKLNNVKGFATGYELSDTLTPAGRVEKEFWSIANWRLEMDVAKDFTVRREPLTMPGIFFIDDGLKHAEVLLPLVNPEELQGTLNKANMFKSDFELLLDEMISL